MTTTDEYAVVLDAAPHTCWDDPAWNGQMAEPGKCAGCDQAAQHPCRFCGYGEVFTTHNDWAHADNGDPQAPDRPDDEWHDSPHVYNN